MMISEPTSALLRSTSIGGARPKALIDDGDRKLIAKFSSTTDTYPVVQGEFVAMELARRAGLHVAAVELTTATGRRALIVERFDRTPSGGRLRIVSALTILGINAIPGRPFCDLRRPRPSDPCPNCPTRRRRTYRRRTWSPVGSPIPQSARLRDLNITVERRCVIR